MGGRTDLWMGDLFLDVIFVSDQNVLHPKQEIRVSEKGPNYVVRPFLSYFEWL